MSFNGISFSDASDIRIGQNKISALYFKNTKIWPYDPEEIYLVFTSEEDDNDFYFSTDSSEGTLDIEVSYNNGKNWQTFTSSPETVTNLGTYIGTLNVGEKMCIRGLNNTYCDNTSGNPNYYNHFISDGKFKASGNIMGLIYGRSSDINGVAFPENTAFNFQWLFRRSKVTDISRLKFPATTLTFSCYRGMFQGCSELVDLNTHMFNTTTTMAEWCCNQMFNQCTSLTAAPELPATTLAANCYNGMFNQCTSLTAAPESLPATTLATECYGYMFYGCSSLATAPALPATTLANNCYEYMFSNCTSLTTAPELPATTLAPYCYENMFGFCTNLQEAPILPATTLVEGCYTDMFSSCTSLSYIKMLATDISATECLWFWVNGVAATGTFVKDYNLKSIPINSPHGIPTGWTIEEVNAPDFLQEYLTIESLADNNAISFNKTESAEAKTIYWSSDKTTWNSVSSGSGTIKTLSNNEKIYIKGSNNSYASSTSLYNYFNSDAEFNISGNIMSLIYGDNFIGQTTLPSSSYIFGSIFRNSKVVDVSNLILPATTLASYCYYRIFNGCTSLTAAPELPATTLVDYCYAYMFEGCTSLTAAPELPATTLANGCYMSMFAATNITTAPELPATTLADSCYRNMFYGCSSLATAPALPATTLQSRCYQHMFYGCTSLTTAPELPATTLVNYCYGYMFQGCTRLNYIKCLATNISASNSHAYWVYGVASTGTFVKPSSTKWSRGTSGIPSGWTITNV